MSLTLKETDELICYDTRTSNVIYYEENEKKKNNITEHTGHLEVLPRKSTKSNENENVMVCSASGGGKSYFVRTYACNYKRLKPENQIFMITQSKEDNLPKQCKIFTDKMRFSDRTYADFLDVKYINAYEYFNREKELEEPNRKDYKNLTLYEADLRKYKKDMETLNIDITRDYKDCLIIFDDFIYFCGKNHKETKIIRQNIINMILQILNLGRKIGVSCIITSHLLYERKYNDLFQNIYSEINKFAFNPSNINLRQLSYVMKSYFGFDSSNIRKINKFDKHTHMVMYNKKPEFLLSENKIELIKI
jgi:hypothetical protein